MEITINWDHSGECKESQVFETVHGPLFISSDREGKYYTLLHAEHGEHFDSGRSDLTDAEIDDIKYFLSKILVKFKIEWEWSGSLEKRINTSQIFKTVHGPLFIQKTKQGRDEDYILLNAGDNTPFYGPNDEIEDASPEEINCFLDSIIVK